MLTPADLQDLQPLRGQRVQRGRSPDGQEVVLKQLSLAEAPDWKALELFQREARLLSELRHPRLPQLLAHGESAHSAWLIYVWLPGTSLQAKLAAGWRPDTATVWALARQALELLDWLHGHHPPVVHRDLKPGNLILQADGKLCLIDFGAVLQHLAPAGGSTMAGTVGYMAPEQFSGRALPVSDLYGLGATLVHLLSGRAPSELPSERLWLRFEDHVQVPEAQQAWLRRLLHPVAEERCPSARTACAELEQALNAQTLTALAPPSPPSWQHFPPPVPAGVEASRGVGVQQQGTRCEIILPPRRLQGKKLGRYVLMNSLGAVYCLVMIANIYIQLGWLLPVLQMPSLLGLLMLSCGGALWEHQRLQHLMQYDTALLLDQTGLKVARGTEGRWQTQRELKWEQIAALELRTQRWELHQNGVVLHYRQPAGPVGRALRGAGAVTTRRLVIGALLGPDEQAWLRELLQARWQEQPPGIVLTQGSRGAL